MGGVTMSRSDNTPVALRDAVEAVLAYLEDGPFRKDLSQMAERLRKDVVQVESDLDVAERHNEDLSSEIKQLRKERDEARAEVERWRGILTDAVMRLWPDTSDPTMPEVVESIPWVTSAFGQIARIVRLPAWDVVESVVDAVERLREELAVAQKQLEKANYAASAEKRLRLKAESECGNLQRDVTAARRESAREALERVRRYVVGKDGYWADMEKTTPKSNLSKWGREMRALMVETVGRILADYAEPAETEEPEREDASWRHVLATWLDRHDDGARSDVECLADLCAVLVRRALGGAK